MFNQQEKDLIQELGLDKLPEERQAETLVRFYDMLQMKLGMVIEDQLSDEQLAEFEKLSHGKSDTELQAWLKQAVPDYDKLTAQAEAELKAEIKSDAAKLRAIVKEVYEEEA